jgi:hypothetical protein
LDRQYEFDLGERLLDGFRAFPFLFAAHSPIRSARTTRRQRNLLQWKNLLGTAIVITKDHSQALADSGQRQFDILGRSAASEREPRLHPSHESRAGAGSDFAAGANVEGLTVALRPCVAS